MAKPILDDALWELIGPLLPPPKPRRRRHPGRKPIPHRAALTGILYVLRTGIPWEYLPQEMGCGSGMTCWRRLRDWQAAGVWERIRLTMLRELRAADRIDWSRAVVDSASLRALKGGHIRAPIPRIALGVARNTTFSPTPKASRWRSRSRRRTVTT
jgi:transposase